jgi:hypothetical protein
MLLALALYVSTAHASTPHCTSTSCGTTGDGTETIAGRAADEVEAADYYFEPMFLRGEPGQRLTLVVENESTTLHNLTIPSLGIDRDLPRRGRSGST